MPLILGWTALATAVLIPLLMSLRAILKLRDLHCTEFSYTFAPLLVTCGTRSLSVLVVGWALTITTVAGLILAIVTVVIGFASPRYANRRAGRWSLAAAVAGVLITTLAILASNPDPAWGTNSWIFFSAAGSTLVIVLVAGCSRLARGLSQRRNVSAASMPKD
jgi:hypothetical protein